MDFDRYLLLVVTLLLLVVTVRVPRAVRTGKVGFGHPVLRAEAPLLFWYQVGLFALLGPAALLLFALGGGAAVFILVVIALIAFPEAGWALRTGRLRARPSVTRTGRPLAYWSMIVFDLAFAAFLIWLLMTAHLSA